MSGLISSQIEAKKAQVTEAQVEVEKAKADLRTRGENKPKRYAWDCQSALKDVWVWSALGFL